MNEMTLEREVEKRNAEKLAAQRFPNYNLLPHSSAISKDTILLEKSKMTTEESKFMQEKYKFDTQQQAEYNRFVNANRDYNERILHYQMLQHKQRQSARDNDYGIQQQFVRMQQAVNDLGHNTDFAAFEASVRGVHGANAALALNPLV